MKKPLEDPELLNGLGRLTVQFALLDASVAISIQFLGGVTNQTAALSLIYPAAFRTKVESLEAIAIEALGGRKSRLPDWNDDRIKNLRSRLCSVNERRNAIVHGYWSVELGPLKVVEGSIKGALRAEAEPIRALVKKLGKRPGKAKDYFPEDEIPKLLADMKTANDELNKLTNEFIRALYSRE